MLQTMNRSGWMATLIITGEGEEHTTPGSTPPAPRPAMALPNMKAIELGAAPQMADPASNSTIDVKKVVLTGKNLYTFPNTS